MKKVTLKDIAQYLGLSQNTISVALRGNPGISPETRELIVRTAQEMGYSQKTKNAQSEKNILLVSKTATAGDSYFFNHLFVMMQNEIARLNYTLLAISTEYMDSAFVSPHSFEQYLEKNHVAGIIILGDIDEHTCKMLLDPCLPVVGASFYLPGVDMSCVVEDNISGAFLLVQHLAQRGYRKIGFIGNLHNVSFWERFSGVKGAFKRFDIPSNDTYDLLDLDGNDVSSVDQLTERLDQLPELPEVFICCNDQMAAVALKVLYNRGLRCPEDIAVVGFDNNEIARLSLPTITSIDTSRNLQGSMSVHLLDQLIRGQQTQNVRLVLPVQLHEGFSVRQN